jgi:hypothetical protein
MYHAIQTYQETSGVHWDCPENEQDIGSGAKITTDAEAQVWKTMIDSKVKCPYRTFLMILKADFSRLSLEKSPYEVLPQQGLEVASFYGEDLTCCRCNWFSLVCGNGS